MEASPGQLPEPIFVGGVGRSGTHVMAKLLDQHPRFHRVRTEARFHSSPHGLADLDAGRTTLEEFGRRMRGHWWLRGANARQGLSRVVERETFDAALASFEAGYEAEPRAAARTLIDSLLAPGAEQAGKPAWVEITGHNVEAAAYLLELYPRARFINMVRDGRAVVAATLKKPDLTDEPRRALSRWEHMIRAADGAFRALPDGAMLNVWLDDLTAHDRERTLDAVLEHCRIDDPEPIREWFGREVSAERAHVGGWRERMAPADVRWVDRRYRRLVGRMRRDGITWAPEPR